MDLRKIREVVIIAMFSDDDLMEQLVLKGGNALDIAHNMNARASIDVDFSIQEDFNDLESVESKIKKALSDRFDSIGYIVFDYKFLSKPRNSQNVEPWWGGYQVDFKIIEKEKHTKFQHDLENLRRNSTTIGDKQQRIFKIDISKYEFCETKQEVDIDDYTIYVYTLPMILIEKLRALCQQLPEYPLKGGTPRARDIYDIYHIIQHKSIVLTTKDNQELFKHIFQAKKVDLCLLEKLGDQREFHRNDWPSVIQASSTPLEGKDFDIYYDFLMTLIEKLKPLWKK